LIGQFKDRFGKSAACRCTGLSATLPHRRQRHGRPAGIPLMATNDVLYPGGRRPLQDVLTAIRLNVPVAGQDWN
jgi:error-prone DNA polymerase